MTEAKRSLAQRPLPLSEIIKTPLTKLVPLTREQYLKSVDGGDIWKLISFLRTAGSIAILTPISAGAREWCSEHLSEDALRYAGGYAVELRYAEDVLMGIRDDGFTTTEA